MDMYLKDEHYERLLDKIETLIPQYDSFQVIDSTDIGNKSTTSNVGLCNEELTEYDMALFPEFFHEERKTMKYRESHQLCPFDRRVVDISQGKEVSFSRGCYYSCSLINKMKNKEKLFSLVALTKELHEKGEFKKAVNSYY